MNYNCHTTLSSVDLISLATTLADHDSITFLPLMFTPDAEMRAVCPCCILDKRVDLPELAELGTRDPWVSMFRKQRSKEHYISIDRPRSMPKVEDGFSMRPVTEWDRRTKYSEIDLPTFRKLGFRGYKFDRNVFFPLAVHRTGAKTLRMGIVDPDLLDDWPVIQHASASWLFRIREVLPYSCSDIIPVSKIGDMDLGGDVARRVVEDRSRPLVVRAFFPVLFERANRKEFKKAEAVVPT